MKIAQGTLSNSTKMIANQRFALFVALIVIVSYVAATPEPQPEPEPSHYHCEKGCGSSQTKCGAVIVPVCTTIHHRCGCLKKCYVPKGEYNGNYGGYGY